ncbi:MULTISPECIES: hypothetical protein [unclassified Streptomyces]|uniref:hypothetical protein n=1 Tax=unclassified Streptomyces TaxID=2593676 RepID=UPI00035C0B49|nr:MULTISPECIES: hypothetical protein [unclassified Streptomyces]MYT27649.1 hypothetical protein [Streptomyces sp. SID8354]
MGRKAAARRHRATPAGTGQGGRADQTGRTKKPRGPADGSPRADELPGGRLPPHQEPKPKRPVRTIRVPRLFG